MSAEVKNILESAVSGERLSRKDGLALFEHGNLAELGMIADYICRKLHPEPYRTYVIDRNINYTNICTSGCKFCAFYKPPGDSVGYVLSNEAVLQKIQEAVDLGATQILMQGGLNPALKIDFFESLFRAVKELFSVQLHSLSAPEIAYIARISDLDLKTTIRRLADAGLDSIPGGGAEILVDRVREQLSPNKVKTAEWLEVMRLAAPAGLRATATMMFGHIETIADRIDHMLAIRSLQDETGVFTAFIPWTYQPGNTALGGVTVGGHEYLKTLAISRIMLDNIPNIQASWVTQGARVAQVTLSFGANDIGSTMIEENVIAAAGVRFRLSEARLIELIHGAGFDAAQRDTAYKILKTYSK